MFGFKPKKRYCSECNYFSFQNLKCVCTYYYKEKTIPATTLAREYRVISHYGNPYIINKNQDCKKFSRIHSMLSGTKIWMSEHGRECTEEWIEVNN